MATVWLQLIIFTINIAFHTLIEIMRVSSSTFISQSTQKTFMNKLWVANHRLSNSGLSRQRDLCGVLLNRYRGSFSEVKSAGLEDNQLPPSSAEARKTMCSLCSTNTGATSLNHFISILSLGKENINIILILY